MRVTLGNTDKIGRNAPCPCGSGQKFKRCCGALHRTALPPGSDEAIRARLRERKADEIVRERQQGFGRPIVAVHNGEHQIVCVGKRVAWGNWRFFTDFLVDYLKDAFGREWGEGARRSELNHPLLRWLERMQREVAALPGTRDGRVVARPEVGYATATFQLAYALYLLEHHDQLPGPLLARLRIPSEFRPALYETLVASAFALAGHTIQVAELTPGTAAEPELWATAKSGKRYAVEAKCRLEWRAECNPESAAFKTELQTWVRRKLTEACKKRLPNPIYWLELSIPSPITEQGWQAIRDYVREAIDSVEAKERAAGWCASPAYVFVTNNPQLVDDDFQRPPLLAALEPFLMDDLRPGIVEVEDGMEIRDRHRDVTWVFECLSEVLRVPQTFDASIPELLDENGEPVSRLRVGQGIDIDFPEGPNLKGELTDILSQGETAWVVVRDNQGAHRSAIIPLTDSEVRAVAVYGDAVFGKPEKLRDRKPTNDVFELYDWLLGVYADYSRDALLRQVSAHPNFSDYKKLPVDQLRVRAAREVAKAFQRARPIDTPVAG